LSPTDRPPSLPGPRVAHLTDSPRPADETSDPPRRRQGRLSDKSFERYTTEYVRMKGPQYRITLPCLALGIDRSVVPHAMVSFYTALSLSRTARSRQTSSTQRRYTGRDRRPRHDQIPLVTVTTRLYSAPRLLPWFSVRPSTCLTFTDRSMRGAVIVVRQASRSVHFKSWFTCFRFGYVIMINSVRAMWTISIPSDGIVSSLLNYGISIPSD
jgi:hypothetical protein